VLARRPPHHDTVAICMEAWLDLQSERNVAIASGMAGDTIWTRTVYGAVPWRAVMAWCDRHGLDDENARRVWSVIQRQDAKRMEREASQRRLNGGS
jgi:hypothetical protein